MRCIVLLLLATIVQIVSTRHSETVINDHNWRNITTTTQISEEEAQAKLYMKNLNARLEELIYPTKNAYWNFETDVNAANEEMLLNALAKYDHDFASEKIGEKFGQLEHYKQYQDKGLVREMDKYLTPSDKLIPYGFDGRRHDIISTQMKKIYSRATVCLTQNDTTKVKCRMDLEPDLTNIMSSSRDFDRLKEVWVKWRDSSGRRIRDLYKEYIKLRRKFVTKRGYKTQESLWSLGWQSSSFKSQVDQLWREVEPYYKKLHAYVRMKLRRFYGPEKMPKDGTIPAHLLGNMWAQTWENIYEIVEPFPGKKLDIGEAMRAQNYTPLKMFQLADKFFTDLGLHPVPVEFYNKSIIEKPTDGRKMSCHPLSFDFYNKQDFRIKMCTKVSLDDLLVVHHEMGHIQYYLQYRDQPVVFRYSANGGFHEAIGDLMSLSVSTPAHLAKLNLIPNYVADDEEAILNHQMKMALHKIAVLPFTYLVDAWRWDLHLFKGGKPQEDMNRHWWWYRLHMQGISPPVRRSESDFDAGAKYHVAYGMDYIRYFVSVIIQFQFHKSLCQIAQPSVPLHQCDIDGNRRVGDRLARMMTLGSSREWTHAMKLMTGSEEMSAKPLIEYFAPLFKWIDRQLVGEKVGWTVDVDRYMENSTK